MKAIKSNQRKIKKKLYKTVMQRGRKKMLAQDKYQAVTNEIEEIQEVRKKLMICV